MKRLASDRFRFVAITLVASYENKHQHRTNDVQTHRDLSCLVGGFNPFEKYSSNWIISPGKGEKKCFKPPPGDDTGSVFQLNVVICFDAISHSFQVPDLLSNHLRLACCCAWSRNQKSYTVFCWVWNYILPL